MLIIHLESNFFLIGCFFMHVILDKVINAYDVELQVYYHSFLDAISTAVSSSKLIHLLVLWGALDDQSC